VRIRFALYLLGALPAPMLAQQTMVGYTPANAAKQRELEASAIRRPSPAIASTYSRELSKETHVAGTPAQARTRDYVIAQMKKWGIETEVRAYDVWMPHPVSVKASRVSPAPKEFALAEPPVAGDPTSRLTQYPTVNGYSGEGDVTADVVYVNYGLIEDYAQLDSMGISVRGKIAVARYGRSFRGIKAREAEKHGAVGLFIYSDPQDDGYVAGDVYPDGPMRNPNGVQRGSILNPNGDPSTPGYGSTPGAPRLTPDRMEISHIPVIPIGYGNAGELLKYLKGPGVAGGRAACRSTITSAQGR
jgi:N-acetylated-alpha-linked acidic dipeptidase